jgi:hypothetical protein
MGSATHGQSTAMNFSLSRFPRLAELFKPQFFIAWYAYSTGATGQFCVLCVVHAWLGQCLTAFRSYD